MPKSVNPLLKRKSPSPFSTAQRTKPGSRKSSLAEKEDARERLDDIGGAPSLISDDIPQDVVGLIRYIQEHTFEDIPDRAAGMNSTQISHTLRFRAALPPIVSVAHLHALSQSPTNTERELARLLAMGKVRRVAIPGRGKGGSSVGEGVVVVSDWKDTVQQEGGLDEELKQKYAALMDENPTSPTTPVASLTTEEIRTLVAAGYLTNPSILTNTTNSFSRTTGTIGGSISNAGFSAASGTLAAIGGLGAIHDSGGSGSTLATKDNRPSKIKPGELMSFSLPSTGPYLKLLTEARLHLLHLLKQLSPRYKEATKAFLEEKWNGNVPDDPISIQKRMRGEFNGILPGRTKRWRTFYGLEFDWVLAECVGSGLVELFDTGSVGVAVRGT